SRSNLAAGQWRARWKEVGAITEKALSLVEDKRERSLMEITRCWTSYVLNHTRLCESEDVCWNYFVFFAQSLLSILSYLLFCGHGEIFSEEESFTTGLNCQGSFTFLEPGGGASSSCGGGGEQGVAPSTGGQPQWHLTGIMPLGAVRSPRTPVPPQPQSLHLKNGTSEAVPKHSLTEMFQNRDASVQRQREVPLAKVTHLLQQPPTHSGQSGAA
ncbi:Hypothetical predicted protein, partial [Podarcis lilfordi]